MAETLKKIIDYLNNDNLSEAFALCETSEDKKIEHIIFNIKGVILFKQQKLALAKIEFLKSINSAGRFTVNTLTSLGTFDLASRVGMTKNETDIGLTLAKVGVSSGPYLVLPIIGPSNLRDFSGDVVEFFIDPV